MKNLAKLSFLFLILSLFYSCSNHQNSNNNFAIIYEDDSKIEIIEKAANISPSQAQYDWQKLETTAFLHFSINTFSDNEWGSGDESPKLFNPSELDAKQWVDVCKKADLKMIIITAKHHDGFCLWPSEFTEFSMKNSPYKNGNGDIVKELSEACKDAGIKFGVYLSPWDRHEKTYGTPQYNDFFLKQLSELLSNYGKIDEVWFDGACGEGENGKKQVYDWPKYYKLIRELQPDAVIAVAGPDIRWVGTESGYGRETEWSVVPAKMSDQDKIAENSQQKELDSGFKPLDMTDKDLGSRDVLYDAQKIVWYPSEVDVSIRPGWFYHKSQDNQVKTTEKLIDIYYSSVGRNSLLLLNIPPDRRGLIHENDQKVLEEWSSIIDATFEENLIKNSNIIASSEQKSTPILSVIDNDKSSFWAAKKEDSTAVISINFDSEQLFDVLMLKENIQIGQRIEKFILECFIDGKWIIIAEGTTVGYKRLIRFPAVKTKKVRVSILESRLNPTLMEIGLFKQPPAISITPESAIFKDQIEVELSSDDKDADIFYTVDGSTPDRNSKKYSAPILLNNTTTLKGVAIEKKGKKGICKSANFGKSEYEISSKNSFSEKYSAQGLKSLIDGFKGSLAYGDGFWQGYYGDDFEVIIDLSKIIKINSVGLSFLQNTKSWIFVPESVTLYISKDGDNYNSFFSESYVLEPDCREEILIKNFISEKSNVEGRFLKIVAKNIGKCPEWHKGAGASTWLFVDEISINK